MAKRADSSIRTDTPIRQSEDDLLGWTLQAKRFSNAILQLDASEGLVVGIVGTWGSGKTSFINLVRERLKPIDQHEIREDQHEIHEIIDFNPWMFRGTRDLVFAMCFQLSSSLRRDDKYKDLAKNIVMYGAAVAEIASPRLSGLAKRAHKWAKAKRAHKWAKSLPDLSQLRREISNELYELKKPIVVVVDDVDRLEVEDVRQVFKCIRLTAAFPNMIYVVACDRYRTARALNEALVPSESSNSSWGQEYLAKILQVTFNIPVVDPAVLESEAKSAIEDVWRSMPDSAIVDDADTDTAIATILMPLVKNMRDVRRFANAILVKALSVPHGIPRDYLIALESIRVFLPDSFVALCAAVDGLTRTPKTEDEKTVLGGQVRAVLDSAGEEREVIWTLINLFFPAAVVCVSDDNTFSEYMKRNLPLSMFPREDRYGSWPEDKVDRRKILDRYLGRNPVDTRS